MITRERLAKYIDHTMLKPYATVDDVKRLCDEAKEYGFAAVCVNLSHVSLVSRLLRGTEIRTCGVVGFPLGATLPEVKAFEAKKAIEQGASELDMVINIGALKSGDYSLVKSDIEGVVRAAKKRGALTKVIIETCYLTDEEKRIACKLAKEVGADYVKTSTGFGPKGATVYDVKLMREVVGPDFGIKVAGGIRNAKQTLALIQAGATRIGTSSGVEIIKSSSQKPERNV